MNNFIPVCEPLLMGNELKYVTDTIETGWISSAGKYVSAFEEKFAAYCGVKYGVAVCNGTVAIHLALVASGISKGDEVIIPNFTMIATAFAVCYTGAKPVFIDADEKSWNIDVNKIEEKITSKTKAIIPVHIFGLPCDMDAINFIAKKHNLIVIEDAAEAHGAIYNCKKVGGLSDIACFSFFANKNITTGEGGMVVTNDENIYKKIKYFKNLCFPLDAPRNYIHEDIGFNYRMSNIHAAIGLAQTEKADLYKSMRIKNGKLYRELLSNISGIQFQIKNYNVEIENVYWMNGLLLDSSKYGKSKDELVSFLKDKGIDTRAFFTGMNKQPALIKYGCEVNGDYHISEKLSENGFYLPSGSGLKEEEIRFICTEIIKYGGL